MSTTKTGLYLRGTPLNPAFKGTPQEFFEEILAHLDIIAPYGVATFVLGSQMPTSDQGPWLKNNVEWWVFDLSVGTYVPLVLNQSLPTLFYLQVATPDPVVAATDGVLVWFQIDVVNGVQRPKAVNLLLDGTWQAVGTPTEGTTANRPVNPVPYSLYYDTDIEAMLIWERLAWRTQDGVKGDTKYVTWNTRADALAHNPGWEILWDGPAGVVTTNRGMTIGQASQDFDGSNPFVVAGQGVAHSQGSVSGDQSVDITLVLANLPAHQHDIGYDCDTIPMPGLTPHGGSNYPVGEREFQYIDDKVELCDDSNLYGRVARSQVGRTRLTGPLVPTPIAVTMDPARLWLFCLRKA